MKAADARARHLPPPPRHSSRPAEARHEAPRPRHEAEVRIPRQQPSVRFDESGFEEAPRARARRPQREAPAPEPTPASSTATTEAGPLTEADLAKVGTGLPANGGPQLLWTGSNPAV